MCMQKVDEIDDLQHHLCNLEVVKDHIILHHELEGPMMVVKNQIVGVPLYFLLSAHICWDLALWTSSVFDGDAVKSYKIGA